MRVRKTTHRGQSVSDHHDSLSILIIEDDAVDRKLLERFLTRSSLSGFDVRCATTLKEAFQDGQQLSVRNHSGQLVSIGTVKSVIKTNDGMVSLPNSVLTEEEVTVLESGEAE